jgi:hypothetical protein
MIGVPAGGGTAIGAEVAGPAAVGPVIAGAEAAAGLPSIGVGNASRCPNAGRTARTAAIVRMQIESLAVFATDSS